MFVMLSGRDTSVHERQAETIKKKNRLTAKLGTIITKRTSNNYDCVYPNTNKSVINNRTNKSGAGSTSKKVLSRGRYWYESEPITNTTSTNTTIVNNGKRNSITTTTTSTTTTTTATPTISSSSNNNNICSNVNTSSSRVTNLKQKSEEAQENFIHSIGVNSSTVNRRKNIKTKAGFTLDKLNNYRRPPTLQVPVATILNDLSPVPGAVKVKNKGPITHMSPMTPKGLQNESPDIKAMRYYRLWIYTCNAVLLMAVIIFCGVAGKVLVADYKRLLVTGLNLGQPNFIYAYLALLVQSGFLQLIGCIGALRLSEKLLNAYWLLLLVLLIGDVILGIFWIFKFDKILQELQPILRYRLATEYGNSIEFSELWDRLQSENRCCGVIGPQDFSAMAANRSYPTSCCASTDLTDQMSVSRRPLASAVVFKNDDLNAQQKSNLSDIADTAWSHVVSEENRETKSIPTCKAVFPQGCTDRIVVWLRKTADILFILGYCVIAFLKLCFLGILRYEIREMIQKIKLLQNEMAQSILETEFEEQQLTQVASTSINGGLHAEPKVGNRDRERSRLNSGESERESLLVHESTTPRYLRNKNLYGCTEGAVGGESDSNSNCALIVEDAGAAAAAAAARALNTTNNYELTEFDTRGPTYRRVNAPIVTRI